VTWSETENVAWKTLVMGTGWSSPVVSGNDLWLTTATDAGKTLRAYRFDSRTGDLVLRTKPLFQVDASEKISGKNGHATPTPVLDGGRVFVHFGANGTACLDRNGSVIWKRVLSYYHHHGPATSPVLAAGTLVIVCDGFTQPFYDQFEREGVEVPQFVVGLDPATGEIRWKTPRPSRHSYSTPLVVEVGGRPQVVCPGGDGVWAYDPVDGKELWTCRFTGHSLVPCPVAAQGLIFVCTGYYEPSLLAIRQGAEGDCTDTHIAWQLSKGVPLVPSPIVAGDHLFVGTDEGILTCVAIKTGKVVWRQRLGGHFAASPILANDRLYFTSEEGVVHILRAGPKFEELAQNQLPGKFLASPAVSGNRLYFRSDHYLYCIADAAGKDQTPKLLQTERPQKNAPARSARRDAELLPVNAESAAPK
jgi:outer membrane protein assembly factor BamB